MTRRSIVRIVAIAPLMILTLFSAPGGIRVATADGCPDAEVVFARGTNEHRKVHRAADRSHPGILSKPRTHAVGLQYGSERFHSRLDGLENW